MPEPDAIPAVVLGSGITALGVTRVLRRSGVPVYAAAARPENLRHSRFFRPVPGPPLEPGAPLADWLSRLPLERAVLMPCSDARVSEVAALEPALQTRFPASVPRPDVLGRVVDKGPFARVLSAGGIPHPFSRVLTAPADLADVPEAVFNAAFLKPRDSQSFFARFEVKAFAVRSRADAMDRLAGLEGTGLAMILQEYIPGPASAHIFVDGYVDAGGRIRALFVRQRLRMFPLDFGNSSYMVSIRPDEAPDAVDAVRRLLAVLDFTGIFSVELKRDTRDGICKVLELNARPWWYVEFAARSGVDVCRLAYDEALGRPLPDKLDYRPGRTLMYPPYDLAAVRARQGSGLPSWPRWIGQALRADQPLFRLSDPWPGLYELGEWLWHGVRRRLGGAA